MQDMPHSITSNVKIKTLKARNQAMIGIVNPVLGNREVTEPIPFSQTSSVQTYQYDHDELIKEILYRHRNMYSMSDIILLQLSFVFVAPSLVTLLSPISSMPMHASIWLPYYCINTTKCPPLFSVTAMNTWTLCSKGRAGCGKNLLIILNYHSVIYPWDDESQLILSL
ncbi:hypothetical protein BDQ17DRAFT_1334775 [Cyathus striatus]|nr:hypothetical protein BDQ17DRAFT_1334775 [Cyathus striatus]